VPEFSPLSSAETNSWESIHGELEGEEALKKAYKAYIYGLEAQEMEAKAVVEPPKVKRSFTMRGVIPRLFSVPDEPAASPRQKYAQALQMEASSLFLASETALNGEITRVEVFYDRWQEQRSQEEPELLLEVKSDRIDNNW